jgi:hypothetical protein
LLNNKDTQEIEEETNSKYGEHKVYKLFSTTRPSLCYACPKGLFYRS